MLLGDDKKNGDPGVERDVPGWSISTFERLYIYFERKKAQIIWMITQNQFVKRSQIDVPSKEQNDQFGIHLSVPLHP